MPVSKVVPSAPVVVVLPVKVANGPDGTNVNDPVTVPLGSPVVASLSFTLAHVQGPRAGCALAVMANSRATEPTNSFVSVLIVATEVNIPRCGAVVEVIRKASAVYYQRGITQSAPMGLVGAAGLGDV